MIYLNIFSIPRSVKLFETVVRQVFRPSKLRISLSFLTSTCKESRSFAHVSVSAMGVLTISSWQTNACYPTRVFTLAATRTSAACCGCFRGLVRFEWFGCSTMYNDKLMSCCTGTGVCGIWETNIIVTDIFLGKSGRKLLGNISSKLFYFYFGVGISIQTKLNWWTEFPSHSPLELFPLFFINTFKL